MDEALKKRLRDVLPEWDCGDNSCRFRPAKFDGGMRTNGGCRCLQDLRSDKRLDVTRLICVVRQLVDGEET